ncbi:SMI1/KNR4 family protein [Rubinisphaera margarita]|uniref:SMI1/KNR4 family protein n=1 Tax=Rubinisphaera margarita TaxID=2909586 RepID=UPI001EE918AB|nr:SMI1/KNR4 family protein [Rubinisphaera margarita]MCG6155937.1 SMI1/KNR4 family protein [Rubinisphaera margarita]
MESSAAVKARIERATDLLIGRGVATENTIRGCTSEEIERVEQDAGSPLPLAYREFLARMGRGALRFYYGTDIFFPAVLGLTLAARELVAEEESRLQLPDDAIAIIMHQGYQFCFIRSSEGDDPPVYYYMEQSSEFIRKSDHFTEFLIDVACDPW